MSFIILLLIISLALNAVLYYMSKSYKINFTEKLHQNDFFEEDEVHVDVQRHFEKIIISVNSKQLNFNVTHDMKEGELNEIPSPTLKGVLKRKNKE